MNTLVVKKQATVAPTDLVLDSVLEARFFSQHRPLALGISHPAIEAKQEMEISKDEGIFL
jgi:hypothetical protein